MSMPIVRATIGFLVVAVAMTMASPLSARTLVVFRVIGDVLVQPGDAQWNSATAVNIPMGWVSKMGGEKGPVTPMMTVKAIHNGSDIAFLLVWDDATRNVDLFQPGDFADAVAVLFDKHGAMGTHHDPVNIWYWNAATDHAQNILSGGERTITHTDGDDNIEAISEWSGGRWRVVMHRPLQAIDHDDQYQLNPGATKIGMNFASWDGTYGQRGGDKFKGNSKMDIEP